jgi:uridylate kinase
MNREPKYRRILLKLSGEALLGEQEFGIDHRVMERTARALQDVHACGIQIAVVLGGGNIYRGVAGTKEGVDRVTGDFMGMLATVINSLALQNALEKMGVETRLQTAIEMREVAEPFIRRRAIRHLEQGRIVLFGAGTGHPFFTTDTTAALRAAEIEAEVLLMAKNRVDGIYTGDPRDDPTARKLLDIDYEILLKQDLKVMDAAAASLSRDTNIPIIVFDFAEPENIKRIIYGEQIGTLVRRRSYD